MTKLRGGIIGCGMISEFHLRGWQRIPEVEIVALCDTQLDRAESQAQKRAAGATVYSSAETMLQKERVDFVDILSPPDMHKDHCLLAKKAGAHVICQKPLCPEILDAVELVDAFRDYGKTFVVHDNHRYRPWFRRIQQLYASGFFGEIKYLRLEQHDPQAPAEEYKLRAARGIMLEYGVHLVDMMRSLLGEPQRVTALFAKVNPRVQGESLAVATYECSGAVVVIDIAWKPAPPEHARVIVEGKRGTALYEGTMTRGDSSRFRLFQEGDLVFDEARSPLDDYAESFYLIQRDVVNSLGGGTPPPQSAKDNLRTLRATFAAYESAAAGRCVTVAV